MMKYLILAVMLSSLPAASYALTADQEFLRKCDFHIQQRTKNIKGKSLYSDSRLCPCMLQEVKTKVKADKLQDVADFYTEKYMYRDEHSGPDAAIVSGAGMVCINKFFTKEQISAENKRLREAAAAEMKRQQEEKAKRDAEAQKKIKDSQEQFKKEMDAMKAKEKAAAKPAPKTTNNNKTTGQ